MRSAWANVSCTVSDLPSHGSTRVMGELGGGSGVCIRVRRTGSRRAGGRAHTAADAQLRSPPLKVKSIHYPLY